MVEFGFIIYFVVKIDFKKSVILNKNYPETNLKVFVDECYHVSVMFSLRIIIVNCFTSFKNKDII